MESAEYEAAMAANLALAAACRHALGMETEEFTVRLQGAALMFRKSGNEPAAELLLRHSATVAAMWGLLDSRPPAG